MSKGYTSCVRFTLEKLTSLLDLPEGVYPTGLSLDDKRDIVTLNLFSPEEVEGITFPREEGCERRTIPIPIKKEEF